MPNKYQDLNDRPPVGTEKYTRQQDRKKRYKANLETINQVLAESGASIPRRLRRKAARKFA